MVTDTLCGPPRSAHHGKEDTEGHHGDIVIVSHGHFSRCFMCVNKASSPPLLPLSSSHCLSNFAADFRKSGKHSTRWCQLEISQGRIFVADTGALHKLGFQHRNFDERSLLGLNLYSVTD